MSRIGKKPVEVPGNVKVDVAGAVVKVEGPKGKLSLTAHPAVKVKKEGSQVTVERIDDAKASKALHGLTRALIQNMVVGAEKGFERKLEIVGVGYNAALKGKKLALTVGFAKPVEVDVPPGVTVNLPDPTHIHVTGPDKQAVGDFAAQVRSVRKPEPYKGTGIKYEGEQIRRKAGKAFGSK
jgi:large subunit ribosomal protein L6